MLRQGTWTTESAWTIWRQIPGVYSMEASHQLRRNAKLPKLAGRLKPRHSSPFHKLRASPYECLSLGFPLSYSLLRGLHNKGSSKALRGPWGVASTKEVVPRLSLGFLPHCRAVCQSRGSNDGLSSPQSDTALLFQHPFEEKTCEQIIIQQCKRKLSFKKKKRSTCTHLLNVNLCI